MRVVASIEARMASTRLPGKMAIDIAGKPVLVRVIERLRQAKSLDDIVVATTTLDEDSHLVRLAGETSVPAFCGSKDDVLKRVLDTHSMMRSDVIVEICGDCPLIDPDILDRAVKSYLTNGYDVVTTCVEQSYPQGTEIQVFSREALSDVACRTVDPVHREHVSLFFYENPSQYRINHLKAPEELRDPELRLQLDYPEDLALIRKIYDALIPSSGQSFRTGDILQLLKINPDLRLINAHCQERTPR